MIQSDLYTNEILQFLRTLTIKNIWFAFEYLKSYAKSVHLTTDQVSPFSNPYYHNLCGFYTSNDTAIILDNGVTLTAEYAEENQYAINRLQLPNKAYDNLCRKYPQQVDLIKAILYPVVVTNDEIAYVTETLINNNTVSFTDPSAIDIVQNVFAPDDIEARATIPVALSALGTDTAGLTTTQLIKRAAKLYKVITAPNLSVFAYDELLLEEWERNSIINAINEFLSYIKRRWYVAEFTNERLYGAAIWNVLQYYLITHLHMQRIKNIKTPSVHSYHIWEYLRSRGFGNFSHILNREQQLYLYNNLDYLFANKGKTLVLKELSDHLLEPNGVEVFGKLMLLDTSNTLNDCKKSPRFISTSIGGDETPTQRRQSNETTLDELLTWEETSGLEPLTSLPWITDEQSNILQNVPETAYRTKLIEFDRIPRYAGYEDQFISFYVASFLHEWNAGKLETMRLAFLPSYYDQTLVLKATDVIYLLTYVALKLTNQTPNELPTAFLVDYALRTSLSTTANTFVCAMTKNSRTLIPVDNDFSNIYVGMSVSGDNIPANSIVISLENDHIVISHPVTLTADGVNVTIQNIDEITPEQIATEYNWFKTDIDNPTILSNITVPQDRYNILNNTEDSVLFPFLPAQNTATADATLGYRYDDITAFDNDKNAQFLAFHNAFMHMRGTADTLQYHAFNELFIRHLTLRYTFTKTPPDGLVTFEDWIGGDSRLSGLLSLHETTDDTTITWESLLDQIMKRVLPIKNSPFVGLGVFNEQEYSQLVRIIIKLCSYNVSFLTKRNNVVNRWLRTAYTGLRIQNKSSNHVSMLPISLASRQTMSTLARETRIGMVGPLSMHTFSYTHNEGIGGGVTTEQFGHSQYIEKYQAASAPLLNDDVAGYLS